MQALFRPSSGRCRAICLSVLMVAVMPSGAGAAVAAADADQPAQPPSEPLANLVATSPRAGEAVFGRQGRLFRARAGDLLEGTALRLESVTADGVMLRVQATEAGPPLLLHVPTGRDVRDIMRSATAEVVPITPSVQRIVAPARDGPPGSSLDTRARQ